MFPVSREFADPVSAMEETIGSQKIGRRSPSPSRLDDSGDEDSESEDSEPGNGVEATTATPLSGGATFSADASGSAESLLLAREWAGKKEDRALVHTACLVPMAESSRA